MSLNLTNVKEHSLTESLFPEAMVVEESPPVIDLEVARRAPLSDSPMVDTPMDNAQLSLKAQPSSSSGAGLTPSLSLINPSNVKEAKAQALAFSHRGIGSNAPIATGPVLVQASPPAKAGDSGRRIIRKREPGDRPEGRSPTQDSLKAEINKLQQQLTMTEHEAEQNTEALMDKTRRALTFQDENFRRTASAFEVAARDTTQLEVAAAVNQTRQVAANENRLLQERLVSASAADKHIYEEQMVVSLQQQRLQDEQTLSQHSAGVQQEAAERVHLSAVEEHRTKQACELRMVNEEQVSAAQTVQVRTRLGEFEQ